MSKTCRTETCVAENPEVEEKIDEVVVNTDDVVNFVKKHTLMDSDDYVVAKEVWRGRYRVNVWKYNPNKIVRSYFVKVSDNGCFECKDIIDGSVSA